MSYKVNRKQATLQVLKYHPTGYMHGGLFQTIDQNNTYIIASDIAIINRQLTNADLISQLKNKTMLKPCSTNEVDFIMSKYRLWEEAQAETFTTFTLDAEQLLKIFNEYHIKVNDIGRSYIEIRGRYFVAKYLLPCVKCIYDTKMQITLFKDRFYVMKLSSKYGRLYLCECAPPSHYETLIINANSLIQ